MPEIQNIFHFEVALTFFENFVIIHKFRVSVSNSCLKSRIFSSFGLEVQVLVSTTYLVTMLHGNLRVIIIIIQND